MKKRNQNGFSIVELLGVIVLLGIIMLIAVPAVTQFIGKSKKTYYQSTLDNIESAAMDYLIDYSDLIPDQTKSKKIELTTLIEKEYIAEIKDPDTKEVCKLTESYVTVTNNGYDTQKNSLQKGTNMNLKFDVCLKCNSNTYGTCK